MPAHKYSSLPECPARATRPEQDTITSAHTKGLPMPETNWRAVHARTARLQEIWSGLLIAADKLLAAEVDAEETANITNTTESVADLEAQMSAELGNSLHSAVLEYAAVWQAATSDPEVPERASEA